MSPRKCVVALGLAGLALCVLPVTAQQGPMQLRNQFTAAEKCLDVANDGTQSNVIMAPCANTPSQRWERVTTGEQGIWSLRNGLGRCLDIVYDGRNNRLKLTPCARVTGQMWEMVAAEVAGHSQLRTRFTGPGRCLDVVNDGVNNQLTMADCGRFTGQYWSMSGPAPALVMTTGKAPVGGLPKANSKPGEDYRHENCGLSDSAHAAMYQRCLAHTGCEIIARKLSACNQMTALLAGLSERLGARTDITNADLFEVAQPAPTNHAQLMRYIDEARAISEAEPGAPLWRTMSWGQRNARLEGQIFTYFEGRATLLPGEKVAKSTGSRMAIGRGVAITEWGEMMRGDFKDGALHGIGQTLRIVYRDGIEMSAGRFHNGWIKGLSLSQRWHGEVTESMWYAKDKSASSIRRAGIQRNITPEGRMSIFISRSDNDLETFRHQTGRIDPFKTNQLSDESRTPQLSGGSAKP